MGGGGGSSGAVEFPDYIMDTHANYLAGSGVNDSGDFSASPSFPTFTLTDVLDDAHSDNPYSSVTLTDPTTKFKEFDTQFDSFYNFATGVSTSSIEDLVSAAFDAVNVGGHTSDLQDISQVSSLNTASEASLSFDTAALDTTLSALTQAHSEITSLISDGSTPDWSTSVQTASDKLRECDIKEEAKLKAVIGEAASQAEYLLEDAIGVAQDIASRQEITDLINEFSSRRETAHQRQVGQFNAQMADGNAVNSSAYMMGLALLKSEQQREESQFDKEITFEVFNNAINRYVQSYGQNLEATTRMEITNAQQHNNLLADGVRAILEIKLRDWRSEEQVSEADLVGLFGQLFNAQLNATLTTGQYNLGLEEINAQTDQFNKQLKAREEELNLNIDRINKEARERRFLTGVQSALNLITNRAEFEKAAADLKTEQKRIDLVGTHEFETGEAQIDRKEATWRLKVTETAANILAAPQSMARSLPEERSTASKALGGALTGVGTGAAVGSVVPVVGTGVGAGVGAVVGGLGGLLG